MFNLETRSPQPDPRLSQHILYYYFLRADAQARKKTFLHFPHYRSTLNLYDQADVWVEGDTRQVCFNPDQSLVPVWTPTITRFYRASLSGPLDIVGIVFQPLGGHYFFSTNELAQLLAPARVMDQAGATGAQAMLALKELTEIDEKVAFLDDFFLSHYRPFVYENLVAMVRGILASGGTLKVAALAEEFGLSRRTLLRQCRKYLACSLSEFKRVVKFRHAFDSFHQQVAKPSLIELTYSADYYDQSDFIKHFKALTGQRPSEHLPQVTVLGERDLYWLFT